MHRFFVEPENLNDGMARISGSDARHLRTVMRLGIGDEVCLIDGKGSEYTAKIEVCDNGDVVARVLDFRECVCEPEVKLTLLQAVPKGDKMDFIVQKCTELGTSKIVPCITQRCVTKLDGKKAADRVTRWQRIALEAAKQCGRGTVPTVESVIPFEDAVHNIGEKKDSLFLMPWELEKSLRLRDVLQERREGICSMTFAIGPEGGFAVDEVDVARENGALTVGLGSRILRTETAGMAVCTMVLYELGEIG